MNFLKGFTPDGYCGEGTGYWNYGFGHYVLLSEEIRLATGGQIDLLCPQGSLGAGFVRGALRDHRRHLPGLRRLLARRPSLRARSWIS